MKNKWGGNRRKRFYSEIWENAVCVCVCVCWGRGVCENPSEYLVHV